MSNQDLKLLTACTENNTSALFTEDLCEYPLDTEVIEKLLKLKSAIRPDDDDYALFRYQDDIDSLWSLLLKKSIKCLRYYDSREPFITNEGKKIPKAYGMDSLKSYYNKYKDFEKILYGSSQYYRDHVIHVFRTWLCGVELLIRNDGENLENIGIKDKIKIGNTKKVIPISSKEKISMWTLIALTHDLGYPLEKARNIIGVTQNMISTFVSNPDISADFSFHGVQNYMNDFVVRLMSSKMEYRGKDCEEIQNPEKENKPYVARLQPKYYFKFQKSLERNEHGILSALIIYKLLTYFLESDYNINEDYCFGEEDCRQFYVRREILRAIASHTCNDVYQMYMGSFSFLLRICDDTQEWGRKNISELYVKSMREYELDDIDLKFNEAAISECTISEKITVPDEDSVAKLLKQFHHQSITYITIFRDGQDTSSRDFSFNRILTIKCENIEFSIKLSIPKDNASQVLGKITYCSTGTKNEKFGKNFFRDMPLIDLKVYKNNGQEIDDSKKPSEWRIGEFEFSLSD